jgi:hypothetical protein
MEGAQAPSSNDSDAENAGPNGYEQERLERIRRNQEMMRSLGLGLAAGGAAALPSHPKPCGRPRNLLGAQKRPPPPVAAGPVRRSARHRGGAAGRTDGAAEHEETAELEPELQYDDSSVHRYVCDVLSAPAGRPAAARLPPAPGACVAGFARLRGALHDAALARAYSVDWKPGLVAAAGKDGVVTVWGSHALEAGALAGAGEGDDVAPLLSERLHKGWVSDVQFLSSSSSSSSLGGFSAGSGGDDSGPAAGGALLLTAGNDGGVCVWDVAQCASQGRRRVPRCLARGQELHRGGVFSMHEAGGRVLTASKDGSVVVSALRGDGGLMATSRHDDLHGGGVVKCARWRRAGGAGAAAAAPDVFASCGNDRAVRIVDARQGGAAAAVVLEGGHSSAVNCVRWSPAAEHLLLSASHDPHVLLHDLRAPSQALHSLAGHSAERRIAAIYQPAFVAGGRGVAAAGAGGLSLYDVASGAAVSRGEVGLAVGATCCGPEEGDPLLCTAARQVAMFAPRWE